MKLRKILLFFLLLSCLYRFIPHPYNLTPTLSIFLFAGFYHKKNSGYFLAALAGYSLTDLFLGLYPSLIFTYLSYFLIYLCGAADQKKRQLISVLILSVGCSGIFYLLSNFGVWLIEPMYKKDMINLLNCYIAGMPFYKNTLISTCCFSCFFFLLEKMIKLENYNCNYPKVY